MQELVSFRLFYFIFDLLRYGIRVILLLFPSLAGQQLLPVFVSAKLQPAAHAHYRRVYVRVCVCLLRCSTNMRYSNFCYKSIQNNCFTFFLFLFLHIHTLTFAIECNRVTDDCNFIMQFSLFTRQSLTNTVSNTKNLSSLLAYAQSLSKDLQPFCFFTLQFSFRLFSFLFRLR